MTFIRWLLAVAIIAAAAHGAALYFGPSLIMSQVTGRLSALGGVNGMFHAPRPNAANDAVVRSSPDLLYSTCVYDLSEGPVVLIAQVPRGTYWSAAFYDINTDNYRVINDGQASAGSITVVVTKAGTPMASAPAGAEAIVSPTTRGLILIRTLVNQDADLAATDEVRRTAKCHQL